MKKISADLTLPLRELGHRRSSSDRSPAEFISAGRPPTVVESSSKSWNAAENLSPVISSGGECSPTGPGGGGISSPDEGSGFSSSNLSGSKSSRLAGFTNFISTSTPLNYGIFSGHRRRSSGGGKLTIQKDKDTPSDLSPKSSSVPGFWNAGSGLFGSRKRSFQPAATITVDDECVLDIEGDAETVRDARTVLLAPRISRASSDLIGNNQLAPSVRIDCISESTSVPKISIESPPSSRNRVNNHRVLSFALPRRSNSATRLRSRVGSVDDEPLITTVLSPIDPPAGKASAAVMDPDNSESRSGAVAVIGDDPFYHYSTVSPSSLLRPHQHHLTVDWALPGPHGGSRRHQPHLRLSIPDVPELPPLVSPLDFRTASSSFGDNPFNSDDVLTDETDLRIMEQGLLHLLEDFTAGKLRAFAATDTLEKMKRIREQQETLAKLHFELYTEQERVGGVEGLGTARQLADINLKKLTDGLKELNGAIRELTMHG